jgi:class 3 adenylate cyclase
LALSIADWIVVKSHPLAHTVWSVGAGVYTGSGVVVGAGVAEGRCVSVGVGDVVGSRVAVACGVDVAA